MHVSTYEKNQEFNAINKWLHTRRYRHIIKEFAFIPHGSKVLDIGCAHAKLFEALHPSCHIDYTGVDVSSKMIAIAQDRYGHHQNFKVIHGSALDVIETVKPDVVVALETLEHIPEHEVVRLVEKIAAAQPKRFIASVPIEIGPSIWIKNVGAFLCGYPRYKEYTWHETFHAGLYNLDRLPPHGTGHKGFDWRWLAQTIRHNMDIVSMRTLPLTILPAALGTSMFFVATFRSQQTHECQPSSA